MLIVRRHYVLKMRITLIWLVPAFSFSKKSGMARGPKYGVAFRHDLKDS